MEEYNVGDGICLTKNREGYIRYYGPVAGKKGKFYGVELSVGDGKHDGTFQGKEYFKCASGKGIFCTDTQILFKLDEDDGLSVAKKYSKPNPKRKSGNTGVGPGVGPRKSGPRETKKEKGGWKPPSWMKEVEEDLANTGSFLQPKQEFGGRALQGKVKNKKQIQTGQGFGTGALKTIYKDKRDETARKGWMGDDKDHSGVMTGGYGKGRKGGAKYKLGEGGDEEDDVGYAFWDKKNKDDEKEEDSEEEREREREREAAKKRREEEQRKAREEEERRKKEEEERRKREEEERRRQEEEERKEREEEERRRKEEEERRRRQEEEDRKRREEAERKAREEEDRIRREREEIERQRRELEAAKAEMERQKRLEEERRKLEEEQRRLEEERKRLEDERKRKEEEERIRREKEEAERQERERKRRESEAARKREREEAERRRREEEEERRRKEQEKVKDYNISFSCDLEMESLDYGKVEDNIDNLKYELANIFDLSNDKVIECKTRKKSSDMFRLEFTINVKTELHPADFIDAFDEKVSNDEFGGIAKKGLNLSDEPHLAVWEARYERVQAEF